MSSEKRERWRREEDDESTGERGEVEEREKRRSGEEERRTPLATEIISVARGIARASPPHSPRDGIIFRRERETIAEEERKRRKIRRGERIFVSEKEREKGGEERNPEGESSTLSRAHARARERESEEISLLSPLLGTEKFPSRE